MKYDLQYLLQTVNNNPLLFCERFLPYGRREGNYWLCGDKTGIAGSSMAVHLTGAKTGKWFDYATGEHGNFIDILADRCGSRRLCDLFNCIANYMPAPSMPAPSMPAPAQSSGNGWKRLWTNARAVHNSPVQRYLKNRRIDLVPSPLRFSPRTFVRIDGSLHKLPALLAPITNAEANIIGIAKTFLTERGNQKAAFSTNKRVAGSLRGGAVRFFSPSAKSIFLPDLIIGEGVETIMSVLAAIPFINAAACLTAGNLAIFTPPPTVRRLWVAFDNDHAGVGALNALTSRLENDLTIHAIAPLKNDHNDDLMADAVYFRRRLQSIFSFKL